MPGIKETAKRSMKQGDLEECVERLSNLLAKAARTGSWENIEEILQGALQGVEENDSRLVNSV